MAKPKLIVISGPMGVRHVDGVNLTGIVRPGMLEDMNASIPMSSNTSSHTIVATNNTNVFRRAHTVASGTQGASTSPRRSRSQRPSDGLVGTNGMKKSHSLRMRSSMSRLRQRVGLDRDQDEQNTAPKPISPEPEVVPEPIEKDSQPLNSRRSIARLNTTSSIYSDTATNISSCTWAEVPARSATIQYQPPTIQRKVANTHRQPSVAKRRPLPPAPAQLQSQSPRQNLSKARASPQRADSGTAIDFRNLPADERPLGFQQIMAKQDLEDRMALYKKMREYWARADHGLVEWTGQAATHKGVLK